VDSGEQLTNLGCGKSSGLVKKWNIAYPVVDDSSGKVGKSYGALTTPHMFVVDTSVKLLILARLIMMLMGSQVRIMWRKHWGNLSRAKKFRSQH